MIYGTTINITVKPLTEFYSVCWLCGMREKSALFVVTFFVSFLCGRQKRKRERSKFLRIIR